MLELGKLWCCISTSLISFYSHIELIFILQCQELTTRDILKVGLVGVKPGDALKIKKCKLYVNFAKALQANSDSAMFLMQFKNHCLVMVDYVNLSKRRLIKLAH